MNTQLSKTKTPTVVSVLNLKGGVGKTTVTALLARYASHMSVGEEYRRSKPMDVLAVDLDPQANLSQALMGEVAYKNYMDNKESSIVELFNDYFPASLANPGPTPVHSQQVTKEIPSDHYEHSGKLEIIPSRFDFSDNLLESVRVDEAILAKFISTNMAHKDLILIDCAPTESILTRVAYHASRYVLIPVRTEFFATIGFPLMQQSLDSFCSRNRGHKIDVCGVLINRNRSSGMSMGPHHEQSHAEISDRAQKYGWPVLENYMYHSDGHPKWAQSPGASHLGNTEDEWPPLAQEILRTPLKTLKFYHIQTSSQMPWKSCC